MGAPPRLVGRAVEQLPGLQGRPRVGHFDVVSCLDGPGVGGELVFGQEQAVADPQLGAVLPGEQAPKGAQIDDRILRGALGLALEEVGDRGDGVELELLVGVKLQLQLSSPRFRFRVVILFASRSKSLSNERSWVTLNLAYCSAASCLATS